LVISMRLIAQRRTPQAAVCDCRRAGEGITKGITKRTPNGFAPERTPACARSVVSPTI